MRSLTRKVLIEKSSLFSRKVISNNIWDISFKRLEHLGIEERIEYIVSKILCPIAGTDSYHISELKQSNFGRYKEITIKEIDGTYLANCYYANISRFSLIGGVDLRMIVMHYLNILCIRKETYIHLL